MDTAERTALLEHLRCSRDALRKATSGLTEDQAAFTPAAEQWTIRECAEHVAVAEDLMFLLATQVRRPADPTAANRQIDELILTTGTDRSRKREAPEQARPAGRFTTLREAVEHFERSRDRTVAYVEGCTENLRAFSTKHPVGVIDCYQCMLLMAIHPLRHAGQIEERKRDPGFPKA